MLLLIFRHNMENKPFLKRSVVRAIITTKAMGPGPASAQYKDNQIKTVLLFARLNSFTLMEMVGRLGKADVA